VPGTGVAGWIDQFGNGYDVSQPTGAKQPTLTTLAGQTALNFARASAQVLTLIDSVRVQALAGGSDTAYTVYIVLSAASLPAVVAPFCLTASNGTAVYALNYIMTGTGVLHHERNDAAGDTDATMSGAAIAAGTSYLLRIRFSGQSTSMVLNGTILTPSVPNDVGAMAALDRFTIGGNIANPGVEANHFDGKIAEVITYTGLVSTLEEDRLVTEYFLPRYGLPVGDTGIGVQPSGARIGQFSVGNYWSAAAGTGPDEQNSRTFVCAFWRDAGSVANQYLWGFNSATTGWYLQAGNAHDLRLFHRGASSTYFADIYFGLNVVAWTKTAGGALRWSLNGGVAGALASPGAYTVGGGSAVHAFGYNAAEALGAASQHSLLWNAVIDAELTDADLQTISGQANALDRWHAPVLVTGHASLRWLANWENWDGAAATFVGSGSSPYTMTKAGTGGGRSVMSGYKRYRVRESAVWDSSQLFSQGASGAVGTRRSAYATSRFNTGAADPSSSGPSGLIVDSLASTWNVASWPGQIEAGVNAAGANLSANHNGLQPIPGILQVEGYALQRAVDCPGMVPGNVVLTDGMQTTAGGAIGSASTVLYVRVPDSYSVGWTERVRPAATTINVFDSKGGQIEGLDQEYGIINPTYNAWPMLSRANAGATRVACEGWGSGAWFQRISSAPLRAAFVETLRQLAAGTASNLYWIELGTNDFGLVTYAALATFETDLAAFANAMIALALPGFKLRLVGPTARLNEATNNANGWNLPGLRTSISNVVTAVANANVTYVDASAYVSVGNRPDAPQLHFNAAGHIQYEAAMRAVVGY
jgi:hypothetical protein